MNKKENIIETVKQQKLLPLFFDASEDLSITILRVLYNSGIRVVEYTNRGNTALENFKKIIAIRDKELNGLYLGIGTIKNQIEASLFIDAGADFIISPGFLDSLADYCNSKEILYIPGCMTPREIIEAENKGASIIKLFPGNILGVDFLKSIKDIFPNLLFMPTGGVDGTKESLESWFHAGVIAVGMGSKLIQKSLIHSNEFNILENNIRELLLLINSITDKK